jgi:hypothetical protein
MTLKSATEHIQESGNLFYGLYKQFTYSFSESNLRSSSDESSEYDSAEEECPQLVYFPSIFSTPL